MADKDQGREEKLSVKTHPLYDEYIDDWQFFSESTKGGRQYLEAGHLFSHRLESQDDDFPDRKKRAYYLNFCDGVLSTYTNYIMKEKIDRVEDTNLEKLRNNVSNHGDSIDDFMRKVAYQSGIYGHVHIFVNMKDDPYTTLKTKADEEVEQPYFRIIQPTKVKDWSVGSDGKLNWILIEDEEYNDADPKLERFVYKIFILLERDKWSVEDEDGELIRSGSNDLGEVPIVTCYHKDIDLDMIGESQIKDIAYINRTIFNWCSCIDEMIERQTFSQLVVPDDGTLAEEEETGDPLRKIGTSSMWTFPSDSSHPPSFIAPETANLETIWRMVIAHIREIHRLAGLTGASEDLYTPQRSGKSQQYSFINISSTLAAKATNLERTENELNRLSYKWMGKNPDDIQRVVYPTQFDIEALEAALESTFLIVEREISERLNKELLKKLSRKALPLVSDEIKKEISDEIEKGDGTIKPIMKGIMADENGEVGRPDKGAGPDGLDTKDENAQDRSLSSSMKTTGGSTGKRSTDD